METLVSSLPIFSIQRWIPIYLAATLLALPLSSTAKSIFLSISVLAILLTPTYRTGLTSLFAKGWCRAAIFLFCIALVGCLWSPASLSEKILVLEKYSKLLYLPILVLGFRYAKTRNNSLHAFLLAMIITSGLSVLKFHGYLPFLDINPDGVFRNHIMVGFMLALAAYLSALFFYQQQGRKRLIYGFLFLLFSYHEFFVNIGRTGYVIYFLLMGLLILQLCSWRQAVVGILALFAVLTLVYTQNTKVNTRINEIVWEYNRYHQNDVVSGVGFRLQFHKFAHQLFNRHPLLGNGTGSFTYYFRTERPVPAWSHTLLEPHNQYWLVASEFGLLGVAALFLLFFSLFKASLHLDTMRPIAFAMLIPFILGNLTDSLLFYSGSGYFFILFMALCLGEQLDNNHTRN